MPNDKLKTKDSARLVWDSKPRRAPNPTGIEFQTAEGVINPQSENQERAYLIFPERAFK